LGVTTEYQTQGLLTAGCVGAIIQNTTLPNPPNANIGAGKKADYPPEKMKEFEGPPGGYNWIGAQDTSLLDTQGCEILLIGAGPSDLGGMTSTWFWMALAPYDVTVFLTLV
jgi:hypothetical protein